MNDVDKCAKKLRTTVKLIKSVIAGAVAFALWAVSLVKSHKKKLLVILHTFITVYLTTCMNRHIVQRK
jgi:phosphotransferase system IIB component